MDRLLAPAGYLVEGIVSLNPPGRRQTNKRRAGVPICGELAKLLQQWGEEDKCATRAALDKLLLASAC
jgi:hypothetical protein